VLNFPWDVLTTYKYKYLVRCFVAPSIYVFDSKSSYLSYYGEYYKDKEYSSPLTHMYVAGKEHHFKQLIVSVKMSNVKDRPSFARSLVVILDGSSVYDHMDGLYFSVPESLPLYYNKKSHNLEVKPHKWQFWREPEYLNHHIDRFIGEIPVDKRSFVKPEAYYDAVRNRICLILVC